MRPMEPVQPPTSSSSSVRTVAIVATVIALLGLSIPFTWGGHDDAVGEPITAPLVDPVSAHASTLPEEAEQGDAACMANAKPATDFTLPGLDGKPVKLSAFKGKVVLLNFWATWCGPCRAIAPVLDEIANEQSDNLTIYKLDIDENQRIAGQFGVMSIPTMILFKDGQPVKQIVGAKPKAALMRDLAPHLS